MTNIFIGAIIGISVTILTILIKKWLDNNHLSIRWTRVIGILIINVCSGDINAE